jgi:glutathione S-transferase
MSLELYYHPLASFCWKPLIALYENDTPFVPKLVDLSDPQANAAFRQIWPLAKFPVLRDRARDRTVPESSVIIEYLAEYYPGRAELIPRNPELRWQTQLWDRFYDFYVQAPMQKVVGDALRPAEQTDARGVEDAKAQLQTAYELIDQRMSTRTWALGDAFSLADCAAAPALYYANWVTPLAHRLNTAAYLVRLMQRASFLRVLAEAEPYRAMFPLAR